MTHKLLFVSSTASHIRSFHLPYLKAFKERGYEVHVGCKPDKDRLPFTDRQFDLPFVKRLASFENFKFARVLRVLIQQTDYDLIITHTALASFFTRLAVKGMQNRPKLIVVVHGYLFDDDTQGFVRSVLLNAERAVAHQTDLLLVMNEYDFEIARRYQLGHRIELIPGMGVDFSRLGNRALVDRQTGRKRLGIPQGAFVLIYPAEFSRRKNHELLIRAMARLPHDIVLILAGRGAREEDCKRLANNLGLRSRVIFAGWMDTLGPWYALSDALVTPSRIEGLPFIVMEAMGAGLPIIASAIKGHKDLIVDNESGLLVPHDDIDALAGAIRRLRSSDTLRRSMAEQAYSTVSSYALEEVFPQVMRHYLSFVSSSVCP